MTFNANDSIPMTEAPQSPSGAAESVEQILPAADDEVLNLSAQLIRQNIQAYEVLAK